jgi:hypothetical protein
MKKLVSIVLSLVLCFAYIGTTFASVKEEKIVSDTVSHQIKSIETGEVVGLKTIEFTSEKISKKNNITEIIIKSNSTIEDYRNGSKEVEAKEQSLIYKNDKLISINGEEIVNNNEFKITISKKDQEKINCDC